MTEEIYGDVLFIINFSMDFLSLYIVGRLLHFRLKPWRVIFGASVGAVYGVVELLLVVHAFWKNMATIGVLLIMCMIAFGYARARTYFSAGLLTLGVNMLIGGMMTAAFIKLGPYASYIEIGGDIHTIYGDLPVWLFVVLAAISAFATWGIGLIFRRKPTIRVCRLRMTFGGEEREITGLIDSGNLTEEPISGTPVIFLKERAADFLPAKLLSAMKSGMAALSVDDVGRLRVIPSKTIAGDGILLAAVPEKLSLSLNGTWETRRALVAVDFSDGDYGGFEVLVPEILF